MTNASPHPLIYVAKWLLSDLLSTFVFAGIYAATGNVAGAVGVAIVVSVAQFAIMKRRGVPIDLMQWLSLLLVVVFGGATLLARDPTFVMLKPTLVYVAVGMVMLRPGWMVRYLPPIARERSTDVTTVFGYAWAALMFGTAAANLALALFAQPATWVWFIGVFPLLSKLVLVAVQYTVTRQIVRRRIRASAVVTAAGQA